MQIKIIFEVDALNSVSPGLLSECASIYFDNQVGWTSIVDRRLNKIEEGPLKLEVFRMHAIYYTLCSYNIYHAQLKLLVTESMQRCFDFKREKCKEAFSQHELAGAQNFCTILNHLVNSFKRLGIERETILLAKNVFYFRYRWHCTNTIDPIFYATKKHCLGYLWRR